MNLGVSICLVTAIVFLVFAVVFGLLKGKGAVLITGFNTISKSKRALYDTDRMSRDMRNTFAVWTILMAAGAALSYFVSPYMAIAAFAVWVVLLLKEVHFDMEKAFGKYKIK